MQTSVVIFLEDSEDSVLKKVKNNDHIVRDAFILVTDNNTEEDGVPDVEENDDEIMNKGTNYMYVYIMTGINCLFNREQSSREPSILYL